MHITYLIISEYPDCKYGDKHPACDPATCPSYTTASIFLCCATCINEYRTLVTTTATPITTAAAIPETTTSMCSHFYQETKIPKLCTF